MNAEERMARLHRLRAEAWRADDAYAEAARAEHGATGRWGTHRLPATIASYEAKVAADKAWLDEALKERALASPRTPQT